MKVEILPAAIDDIAVGFAFYEKQQSGLGRYFLDSLLADIDTLALHAGIHRQIFGSHRLLAQIFPFAIYYSVDGPAVRVKAVLDCRREPKRIREKLK